MFYDWKGAYDRGDHNIILRSLKKIRTSKYVHKYSINDLILFVHY